MSRPWGAQLAKWKRVGLIGLALAFVALGARRAEAAVQCSRDRDCPSTQVCEAGQCIDWVPPPPKVPGPAPMPPPPMPSAPAYRPTGLPPPPTPLGMPPPPILNPQGTMPMPPPPQPVDPGPTPPMPSPGQPVQPGPSWSQPPPPVAAPVVGQCAATTDCPSGLVCVNGRCDTVTQGGAGLPRTLLMPIEGGAAVVQDEASVLYDQAWGALKETRLYDVLGLKAPDLMRTSPELENACRAGFSDGYCRASLARAARADRLVVIGVRKAGNTWYLSAAMIEGNTGATLQSITRKIQGGSDALIDAAPMAVRELTDAGGAARTALKERPGTSTRPGGYTPAAAPSRAARAKPKPETGGRALGLELALTNTVGVVLPTFTLGGSSSSNLPMVVGMYGVGPAAAWRTEHIFAMAFMRFGPSGLGAEVKVEQPTKSSWTHNSAAGMLCIGVDVGFGNTGDDGGWYFLTSLAYWDWGVTTGRTPTSPTDPDFRGTLTEFGLDLGIGNSQVVGDFVLDIGLRAVHGAARNGGVGLSFYPGLVLTVGWLP